jgi:hypothetical protein
VAGAAALGIVSTVVRAPSALPRTLGWTLVLGVAASAGMIALDTFGHHPTRQAERAARNLYRDRFAVRLWVGGVALGLAAPSALGALFLAAGGRGVLAGAGACALAGLWFYEDAWVRAGQSVPLS